MAPRAAYVYIYIYIVIAIDIITIYIYIHSIVLRLIVLLGSRHRQQPARLRARPPEVRPGARGRALREPAPRHRGGLPQGLRAEAYYYYYYYYCYYYYYYYYYC